MVPHQKDAWDQHWQDFSNAAYLNPAQTYREQLIQQQIKKQFAPTITVLDIGSGQGAFAATMLKQFPAINMLGVDLSAAGIEKAKAIVPNAHFFQIDMLILPNHLPPALQHSADVAICSEVLEHVDEPLTFLRNCRHFLKKNARLIITVPGGPRSAFDRHIGHRKHYRAKELKNVLQQAGYHVAYIQCAGFPFFNLYKLLTIMRGEKLINDCHEQQLNRFAKFTMRLFAVLFTANLTRSPWGWQLLAVAEKRE